MGLAGTVDRSGCPGSWRVQVQPTSLPNRSIKRSGDPAMTSIHESIKEYRKQLEKGAIQEAYKGLMEYIMGLKIYFKNKYPDYAVSGSIYYGYMDMTYFSVFPRALKDRDLKIAIVFLHEAFRFEVWLSGKNKQVLTSYWQLFEESGWDKYRIVAPEKGVDSIVEHILVDKPDFGDLDALTQKIDQETLDFIQDIEIFLSQQ
jgi:hypothetical protein